MSDILVHLGLVKTASTTLQRLIFSNERCGYSSLYEDIEGGPIQDFLIHDPWTFDPKAIRERLEPRIREIRSKAKIPVVSQEVLSGNPVRGRYPALDAARKIKECFPEAKVFLCLREQIAMLTSLYAEYVKNSGELTVEEFMGDPEEMPPGYSPLCRLDFFRYDQLVRGYRSIFGESRLLVLPLELLAARPTDFFTRLRDFAGAAGDISDGGRRVNAALSWSNTLILRRLHAAAPKSFLKGNYEAPGKKLIRRIARLASRLSPASLNHRLGEGIQNRIRTVARDYFSESNKELARLYPEIPELHYPAKKPALR